MALPVRLVYALYVCFRYFKNVLRQQKEKEEKKREDNQLTKSMKDRHVFHIS